MTLRIVVGCDDAGLQYKDVLRRDLEGDDRVASVVDVGVGPDEHTAYPHVAVTAARMIADGRPIGVGRSAGRVSARDHRQQGPRGARGHGSRQLLGGASDIEQRRPSVGAFGQRVIGIEFARRLVAEWLEYRFDQYVGFGRQGRGDRPIRAR